jgi:hypothetical protein
VSAFIHQIKPAGDIVREMMEEYRQTRSTLPAL